MESFATGLKRINEACKNAGVKVEFYGDEYGFTVRFYRHCGEVWGESKNIKAVKPQNDALEEALDDALENKMIVKMKDNPRITQKELAEQLEVSRATIQRMIKSLSDKGALGREGGKRYGYWVIHNNEQ